MLAQSQPPGTCHVALIVRDVRRVPFMQQTAARRAQQWRRWHDGEPRWRPYCPPFMLRLIGDGRLYGLSRPASTILPTIHVAVGP